MPDPFAIAEDTAEQFEGFYPTPYLCPAKVWTIGYGSTRDLLDDPVTSKTPAITRGQAQMLMRRDLQLAYAELKKDVISPLTDDEGAALMDFIYNLGAGNFRSSTLLRKLNARDYAGASLEFAKWDHADGVVLAGLLRRREAEAALFVKKS